MKNLVKLYKPRAHKWDFTVSYSTTNICTVWDNEGECSKGYKWAHYCEPFHPPVSELALFPLALQYTLLQHLLWFPECSIDQKQRKDGPTNISPHRPQQNQHSKLHTLFSSYSLREALLSKKQLSLINNNRVSGYTNKQLRVVINPFTPKIIIQILLTIQEQMYEWCNENWQFNPLSSEQAIKCQVLHIVWYIFVERLKEKIMADTSW